MADQTRTRSCEQSHQAPVHARRIRLAAIGKRLETQKGPTPLRGAGPLPSLLSVTGEPDDTNTCYLGWRFF